MINKKRITVVIPAYNESKHIKNVIDSIPSFIDKIFVVNDASTDNTANVVKSIKKKNLELISLKQNSGVGGATKAGLKAALKIKSDVIIKMDGDGQMNPNYLPLLIDNIIKHGYDYAKGNRFYSLKSFDGMPTFRFFGNIILSLCTKIASGYWDIIDPQNGYIAIKTDMLKEINFKNLYNDFFFENSLLIELNILNAKVKDVPIPANYGNEKSKLKILNIIFPFIYNLTKSFFRRILIKYFLRGIHPIFLFLFFGFLLFSFGLIFGIIHYIISVTTQIPATTGTVMFSVLPLMMGFELILWAIVLDIQNIKK